MTGMTDEELGAIRARATQATAGPWRSYIEGRDHWGGDNFIMLGQSGPDQIDLYISPWRAEDQDFIAHARQDIPRLLAEVDRLRRER